MSGGDDRPPTASTAGALPDTPDAATDPRLPTRYRPLTDADAGRAAGRSAGTPGRSCVVLDTATGERVFVKLADDASTARREAEVLAAVSHPGIVRCRGWGAHAGSAFLVVDDIDGGDLEKWCAERPCPVPAEDAASLLGRLAEAVGAVHDAGFLHRDLKPANILFDRRDRPVIVDFDAARPLNGAVEDGTSRLTPGYAAPEQYDTAGGEGPWTDVYALGAIGYRLLTGHAPPAADARRRGTAALGAVPLPKGEHGTRLAGAIERALALDPQHRPACASDFAHLFQDSSPPPTGTPPGTQPIADLSAQPAAQPAAAGPVAPADGGAPADDAYPPTVLVQRRPRPPGQPHAVPDLPPSDETRPRRRPFLWVGLGVALLALAASLWAAIPLYERHIKTDWLVDHAGGGDALTIADALARSGDGARIRIRPGIYAETVELDRPVVLEAADPDDPPVIRPHTGPCLTSLHSGAVVDGLAFDRPVPDVRPAAGAVPCIHLRGGDMVFANSRVSGAGPAIFVDGGAPVVRGNTVSEVEGRGIVVTGAANPTIAENTLRDISGYPLMARGGAQPHITKNIIEDSGSIFFTEGATGTLEANEIRAARTSAIKIAEGAKPRIAGNVVDSSVEAGLYYFAGGGGEATENQIAASRLSGIVLSEGASPRIVANTVVDSGEHGILVVGAQGAVVEGNTLLDNKGHGIVIADGVDVTLGENTLSDNRSPDVVDVRTP